MIPTMTELSSQLNQIEALVTALETRVTALEEQVNVLAKMDAAHAAMLTFMSSEFDEIKALLSRKGHEQ